MLLSIVFITPAAESQTRHFVNSPANNSTNWQNAAIADGLEVCRLVFSVGRLRHNQPVRVGDPNNCDCFVDVTYNSSRTSTVSHAEVQMISGFPSGTLTVYPRHSGEGPSPAVSPKLVLGAYGIPQSITLSFGTQRVYGFGIMTGDVFNAGSVSPVNIMGSTAVNPSLFNYTSAAFNFQLNNRYFMGALNNGTPLTSGTTRFFGHYTSDGIWIEALYIARERTSTRTGACGPPTSPGNPIPKNPEE